MSFNIFSHYIAPVRQYRKWWRVELDPEIFSQAERRDRLVKSPREWFTAAEAREVDALTLFPGINSASHDPRVYDRFSDLKNFANLKYISIPLEAIEYLDIHGVAETLEHLSITGPRAVSFLDFYRGQPRPRLFEESLPKLRTLDLLCSPLLFKNFDIGRYPSLEWITTDLEFDKTAKFARMLEGRDNFIGLSLESVTKQNLLENIPTSLIGLDLWSIRPKMFDFSPLRHFTSLQYLSLRNSNSPIDCSIISSLSDLKELELFSFPNLIRPEELLRLTKLEKIHIFISGRDELTDEFMDAMRHNFRHASILSFGVTVHG